MKKLIAVLLSVLMLFSLVSVVAVAADDEEEPTVYLIVFKDYDGTVLSEQNVEEGRFPQQPDVPKREADENGTTYVFIGWRSSLDEQVYKAAATVPAATANATYTATYQEDPVEEVGTTILGFLASVFARMNRIFEQIAKVFEDWKAMLDKMF